MKVNCVSAMIETVDSSPRYNDSNGPWPSITLHIKERRQHLPITQLSLLHCILLQPKLGNLSSRFIFLGVVTDMDCPLHWSHSPKRGTSESTWIIIDVHISCNVQHFALQNINYNPVWNFMIVYDIVPSFYIVAVFMPCITPLTGIPCLPHSECQLQFKWFEEPVHRQCCLDGNLC